MFYKVETIRIRPVICENDEALAHVAFMGRSCKRSGLWHKGFFEQVSFKLVCLHLHIDICICTNVFLSTVLI